MFTDIPAGRAVGDLQELTRHPQVAVLFVDPLTKVLLIPTHGCA